MVTAAFYVFLFLLTVVVCGEQIQGILKAVAPLMENGRMVVEDLCEALSTMVPTIERWAPVWLVTHGLSTTTIATRISELFTSLVM